MGLGGGRDVTATPLSDAGGGEEGPRGGLVVIRGPISKRTRGILCPTSSTNLPVFPVAELCMRLFLCV